MVRQTPANPGNQWLASLRSTAYKNNFQIYTIGTPVKMSHETPELRKKEVAFGKKWVDMADRLGAGHIRVFAGSIPKGATEEQAVAWAVEVYKQILDYAAEKGIFVGVEDDDELTRTSAQIFNILKLAGIIPSRASDWMWATSGVTATTKLPNVRLTPTALISRLRCRPRMAAASPRIG
jgi:sugar phosphate isomerase/epimerase